MAICTRARASWAGRAYGERTSRPARWCPACNAWDGVRRRDHRLQRLLYELTWRGGIGFRYDAHSLEKRGSFTYTGEGWGMTHDEHSLIISDGTNVLRYLDPKTMQVQRALSVSAEGMPLVRLNELERIHGEIWANVWQAPQIARIDPATGHVIGWIDLAPLVPPAPAAPTRDTIDVANGIAYDSASDRIFVTGKFWPTLFEIRVGAPE